MTLPALAITPAFTHTHPQLDQALNATGIPWLRLFGHSDLPRVRSVLLTRALEMGAERVLLLDADTIPTPEGLRQLATSPLVSPTSALWGIYPLRDGDAWSVNPERQDEARACLVAGGGAFKIRTGGLGMCAIHRQSLERIAEQEGKLTEDDGASWWPFCVPLLLYFAEGPDQPLRRRYYADDGSLCQRLTKTGTALWCDAGLRAAHAAERLIRVPDAPE